jgi:hypothetical protein
MPGQAKTGERTIVGLAAARARGRRGGRKPKIPPQNSGWHWAPWDGKTVVRDLCHELGISSRTRLGRALYPWCAVALAPEARMCTATSSTSNRPVGRSRILVPKKRTRNCRVSLVCCRRNRVTLSPEPPGIFRFRLAPAAHRPWAGGLPIGGLTCRLQGCISARGAS